MIADERFRGIRETDRDPVGGCECLDATQPEGFVFDPIPLSKAAGHAIGLVSLTGGRLEDFVPTLPYLPGSSPGLGRFLGCSRCLGDGFGCPIVVVASASIAFYATGLRPLQGYDGMGQHHLTLGTVGLYIRTNRNPDHGILLIRYSGGNENFVRVRSQEQGA